MPDRTCSVPGCLEPHHARGWCGKHHARWGRHGDPLALVLLNRGNLTARFEAKVDRSAGPDACHPWQAGLEDCGYGRFKVNDQSTRAHIIAWEMVNGPVPDGMQIDHECHNRAVLDGSCRPGICMHRRCCNERHLAAKTRPEHGADTTRPDVPCGDLHWSVKLSDAQVAEIRVQLAKGVTGRALARKYGASESMISAIKHGARRIGETPVLAAQVPAVARSGRAWMPPAGRRLAVFLALAQAAEAEPCADWDRLVQMAVSGGGVAETEVREVGATSVRYALTAG